MFNLDRFTKAPAIYDIAKLNYINGQHLRLLSPETLLAEVSKGIPSDHPFHRETHEWKLNCVNVFKEKINLPSEILPFLTILFETHISDEKDYLEAKSWETTPKIREYIGLELTKINSSGRKYVTADELNLWSEHIKGELKIKGKPLFMGMRAVLTHQAHGTDLKFIIPLTNIDILLERIKI